MLAVIFVILTILAIMSAVVAIVSATGWGDPYNSRNKRKKARNWCFISIVTMVLSIVFAIISHIPMNDYAVLPSGEVYDFGSGCGYEHKEGNTYEVYCNFKTENGWENVPIGYEFKIYQLRELPEYLNEREDK